MDHCNTNTTPNTNATANTTNNTIITLPALTNNERNLLRRNDGCVKCQRFFAQHQAANCPNGFPLGAGYRTLTKAMVAAARDRGINAVVTTPTESEETAVAGGSAMIAAVMPPVSTVLGDGTDSEEEEYIAPFQTPHLFWDCLLDGPGIPAPERIRALIDSGAHTVIIDSRLAEHLALRRQKLPKPLEVSLAMGGKDEQLTLKEWVKLKPSDINSRWRSRLVRAIIARNLVCPVILGQPFLKINKLVIDHDISSCTSKIDGFDLMKSVPLPNVNERKESLKDKTSSSEEAHQTQSYSGCKNDTLVELLQHTRTTKRQLDKRTGEQRL